MHKMSSVIGLLFCLSVICVKVTESVVCFHCAYVESMGNPNSENPYYNPDCMDGDKLNSDYANDTMQTGVACMKAVGFVDEYRFVLRRAIKSGSGGLPGSFPQGIGALNCAVGANNGTGRVTANALKVISIGKLQTQNVVSCTLCNDKDQCNGANLDRTTGLALISLAILSVIIF